MTVFEAVFRGLSLAASYALRNLESFQTGIPEQLAHPASSPFLTL